MGKFFLFFLLALASLSFAAKPPQGQKEEFTSAGVTWNYEKNGKPSEYIINHSKEPLVLQVTTKERKVFEKSTPAYTQEWLDSARLQWAKTHEDQRYPILIGEETVRAANRGGRILKREEILKFIEGADQQ